MSRDVWSTLVASKCTTTILEIQDMHMGQLVKLSVNPKYTGFKMKVTYMCGADYTVCFYEKFVNFKN